MTPEDSSSRRRSYRPTENLARELNLREDQIVRARVQSTLEDTDNKVILDLKGKRVVAETRLDVSANQPLIVRVESTDHPIELKVFEQQQAVEELTREDWSQFVEDLGHQATDELLDLIPDLVDEHLALTPDLLETVSEHYEYLNREGGASRGDKLEALSFLVHRDLPVHAETLEILSGGGGEEAGPGSPWDVLLSEAERSEVGELDYRQMIRDLGIDYVNQIGRWPHRASQTLQGRLLGEFQDPDTDPRPARRDLLARLLRLAVCNRVEPGFVLPFPFTEERSVRTGTVRLEGDEERTPADWSVESFFPTEGLGNLQASIDRRGNQVRVEFSVSRESTRRQLRESIPELRESLSERGLEATIVVTGGSPERPSHPVPEPGTPPSPVIPGGVDFQA